MNSIPSELAANKKGIFFTFIAITMMTVFIILFTPSSYLSLEKKEQSVGERIRVVDNYLKDIENSYYKTIIRGTTNKALTSMILYINKSSFDAGTPVYIANFDTAFKEVMVTGNLLGVPIDDRIGKKIMENNTIENWTKKIIEVGFDTYNVNTTINVTNVFISQKGPWQIEVTVELNLSVVSDVAAWRIGNMTVTDSISIEGFYDPAYLAESMGLYPNTIKRSTVEFNRWNATYLGEHIRNGTYVYWPYTSSPNFLRRFSAPPYMEDNSSCCGIHSSINPTKLAQALWHKSYIDYMFWNNSLLNQCTLLFNITNPNDATKGVWNLFPHFKLDEGHLSRYNITNEHFIRDC